MVVESLMCLKCEPLAIVKVYSHGRKSEYNSDVINQ